MKECILILLNVLISFLANSPKANYSLLRFDRYELTDNARAVLDSIAITNNSKAIHIYGHCDQLGSKGYNYILSERRANSVKITMDI